MTVAATARRSQSAAVRHGGLLLCVAMAACGRERHPTPAPGAAGAPESIAIAAPPTETPETAEPSGSTDASSSPFVGTAGVTEVRRSLARAAILTAVRAARHPGFDRIVFEFEGKQLPGHHVEYVDRPIRRCGSGHAVEVAGDGWLRVRLEPADAHDDQGKATIAERDRQRKLALGALRELILTCDFEGQVVWVLGLTSPNRYRLIELTAPPRLVVDVLHR
jgi:hypothetical protein